MAVITGTATGSADAAGPAEAGGAFMAIDFIGLT
jgi:hypothetical protein